MKKSFLFLIILSGIFTTLQAFSAPKYFSDNNNKVAPDPVYKRTITVPQNYILGVEIKNSFNIENVNVPDKVDAFLTGDFLYKGELIAPEGSIISGTVVNLINNKEQQSLLIKFTNIYTPDNKNIPISAVLNTKDKTGILYADENGNFNTESSIITKQPVTYNPR